MKRVCDLCGKEENEWRMVDINVGHKKEWWCWDCYLNSQHEAAASDLYRQNRLNKLKNYKKRNK